MDFYQPFSPANRHHYSQSLHGIKIYNLTSTKCRFLNWNSSSATDSNRGFMAASWWSSSSPSGTWGCFDKVHVVFLVRLCKHVSKVLHSCCTQTLFELDDSLLDSINQQNEYCIFCCADLAPSSLSWSYLSTIFSTFLFFSWGKEWNVMLFIHRYFTFFFLS